MIKQVFIYIMNKLKVTYFILFLLGLTSCTTSDYTKLVKQEMSKNIVKVSLFFGMKLGDRRQTFYDICWQLNKDKLVKQGPRNSFVQYQLPTKKTDSLQRKITMLFYGIFNKDKIMTGMDMKFYYEAWALWNESLHSDKLLPIIKDTLKIWYPGNDFISVKLKKSKKNVLVKVDGNRQIIIKPLADNREIDVQIVDLKHIEGIN